MESKRADFPRHSLSTFAFTIHLPCTGAEAAAWVVGAERVRMTHGRDCYHPETRTVFLSEATWHGLEPEALYRALHEAAHARQHAERPLWFSLRNVWVLRLWIEWDAWRRADVWLRGFGWEPGAVRAVRDAGLGSYTGGMFAGKKFVDISRGE